MGDFLCLPPYEFCEGVVYCGFQAGVGLVSQVGLETLQQQHGQTEAGTVLSAQGL